MSEEDSNCSGNVTTCTYICRGYKPVGIVERGTFQNEYALRRCGRDKAKFDDNYPGMCMYHGRVTGLTAVWNSLPEHERQALRVMEEYSDVNLERIGRLMPFDRAFQILYSPAGAFLADPSYFGVYSQAMAMRSRYAAIVSTAEHIKGKCTEDTLLECNLGVIGAGLEAVDYTFVLDAVQKSSGVFKGNGDVYWNLVLHKIVTGLAPHREDIEPFHREWRARWHSANRSGNYGNSFIDAMGEVADEVYDEPHPEEGIRFTPQARITFDSDEESDVDYDEKEAEYESPVPVRAGGPTFTPKTPSYTADAPRPASTGRTMQDIRPVNPEQLDFDF